MTHPYSVIWRHSSRRAVYGLPQKARRKIDPRDDLRPGVETHIKTQLGVDSMYGLRPNIRHLGARHLQAKYDNASVALGSVKYGGS